MITRKTLDYLIAALVRSPSADNSQPLRFVWDGACLTIQYDTERVAGATFPPSAPASQLAAGAAIESLAQAALAIGVKVLPEEVLEDSLRAGIYFRAQLLSSDAGSIEESGNDLPVFRRHTNRFAYKSAELPGDLGDWICDAHQGDARAEYISDARAVTAVSALIKAASRVRFQTREVHEWLAKSLRFPGKQDPKVDGLDLATLDLPPGGALFMRFIKDWRRMEILNRFGAFKLLAAVEAIPVSKAPALVAVVGGKDAKSVIDAGRLLNRIWIRLNEEAIAVHPYYVVSDQLQRQSEGTVPVSLTDDVARLSRDCQSQLGLGANETLHMLLRIGYPRREAPRSGRLPASKLFKDLSENQV